MKNVVLMTVISIGATMMISGCGKSAIECDDSDAQKTVMEIAEGEIKNQLVKMQNNFATYQAWQELSAEKPDVKQALEEIDKKYSEANPQLVNIRTESKDDDLEKSECAAEITMANGNKVDITYKLSKTSDGDLYAEVFGLR